MKRILALVLLSTACSSEADVEPKSGTWNYNGSTIVTNTCGVDPLTDPSGGFTLTVTGPGKFTVTDESFDNAFECTYDGGSYNCPKRLAGSNQPESSIDATLIYNVKISGTLDSDHELSGTQTVELSCEGADCELALTTFFPEAKLPCTYSYTFSADATA